MENSNLNQKNNQIIDIPEDFLCPITRELMEDPVITGDGHSYEKAAIEEWFRNSLNSPLTNKELNPKNIIPNITLKKAINYFKENIRKFHLKNQIKECLIEANKITQIINDQQLIQKKQTSIVNKVILAMNKKNNQNSEKQFYLEQSKKLFKIKEIIDTLIKSIAYEDELKAEKKKIIELEKQSIEEKKKIIDLEKQCIDQTIIISVMQKRIEELENINVPNQRNNEMIKLDLQPNLIIQNIRQQNEVVEALPYEHKYSWIKTYTEAELYLSDNNIGSNPDDLKHLADGIRNNKTITKLYLYQNNIGSSPDNLKYLADGIGNNKTITVLDLSENNIGTNPDDLKYLADGIRNNTSITELYLSHNKIGSNPDDLKYLADGIRNNTSITELNLYQNNIGSNPDNLKYLADGIRNNTSITVLYLSENNIGSNPDNLKYIDEMKKKGLAVYH